MNEILTKRGKITSKLNSTSIILVIIFSIITFLIGIKTAVNIQYNYQTEKTKTTNEITPEIKEQVKVKEYSKKVTPITIEEIPYSITMLDLDSIGNRYMDATQITLLLH
ncbi:hypothetical protein [Clostridium gasigenes]|uniref:hypothetical protein n=1 Tax=Clostridium gasigenes TaxID=94869 RepID=UPI001C0D9EAF|nr:hypothetical protein [Clostridium gasigenes]MBU3106636.1 hypothetical protein [Clostridium gasigenes]